MKRDLRDPDAVGKAFFNELAALEEEHTRGLAIPGLQKASTHRERVLYAADLLSRYAIPDYATAPPSSEPGGHRRLT